MNHFQEWESQLDSLISKGFLPTKPPVIPDVIRFPFMMVFYRKKVSNANSNYLIAAPVYNFTDLVQFKKNISHKGWPIMTMIFDLPEFMRKWMDANRYVFWKYDNWQHIKTILSDTDKLIIPDMEEIYPCPATQVIDKKGQFRLIFGY